MIRFAENLNKMITAGLGGALEAPRTEVAVGHCIRYLKSSGAVASFETNIVAPIGSLRVDMQPIQEGTGDPSPDNIRPISGRESVTVTRSGVNVFDQDTVFASFGFTYEDDDSWSRENITGIANARLWENPGFVSQISMRFTAKYASDTSTGIRFKFEYTDGTFMNLYLSPSLTYQDYTFTSTPNKVVSAIFFDYGSNNIKTWFKDVQFEASSTSTAYEPYNGQSVTVQLGQTLYGGTVDVTTGVMTVEWENIASYDGEALPGEWISDRDAYAPGTTPTTGAQVCYKLATPFTIQLTPAQLSTLVGENNVWSDAGNISLEYPYYEETEGY